MGQPNLSSGALDADYVTIDARLVALDTPAGFPTLAVQIRSTLFEAAFSSTNALTAPITLP